MGIVAVPVLFQSVFCFSISGSFWSHLYAQYQFWSLLRFLLGLYSRQVDVTKKKAQLSIGTPGYLLVTSLLVEAGHIWPFSVPASHDEVGIHPVVGPSWDLSAKVLYTSGVLRLERAISWVQEQSKVSFDAFQISQGSYPFLGSLFGENLSSKKSAFRRNPPRGCSISHALENLIEALDGEDQLLAAEVQLVCWIIDMCPYPPCPMVHPRVFQDSTLVPLTPSPDFVTPVPVESVPGICSQDRSGSGQGHLMPLCKRGCFQVLPYK